MYDIAIVGAGPAGSTLARLLSSRYRVLLADASPGVGDAEGDRSARAPKLCGGLLAPAAQKELARQGLGLPGDLLVGPQLFAVRTVDRDSGLERVYQRHYVNIDREAFGNWLVELAAENCDYRPGWRMSSLDLSGATPLLRFRTMAGATASCAARLVVGADGAASLVRSVLGQPEPTRYVALQAAFDVTDAESSFGAYFDHELTDHYAWSIPKGTEVLVGAALHPGQGVTQRFATIVERMRESGFGIGEEIARASAPVIRPQRLSDVSLGQGRVALVGEAAGLISPSSAEGVSYALRSAATLAAAVEFGPDDVHDAYARLARPLVAEVLGKTVKARLLSSPFARRAIMASGVASLREDEPAGFGTSLGELLMP